MKARNRFAATMAYGDVDCPPLFEDSFSDEFLEKLRGCAKDFPADRLEEAPVNLDPLPPLEGKLAWEIGPDELGRRLDPADPTRLPPDWRERAAGWRGREHVLKLPVHRGFFLSLGVGDWNGVAAALEALCDEPDRIGRALNVYGEFCARLAERILREVEVDLACFSEPIAGGGGPLLSPAMYERLVLRSYIPVIRVLRRYKVRTIALMSWADIRPLIRPALAAGINCLWAQETHGAGMDYRALRKEFGKDLRLIGGIDLDNLLEGREGIVREINGKLPELLVQGGYIPMTDGRIRANMPAEDYVYYREMLGKTVKEHAAHHD